MFTQFHLTVSLTTPTSPFPNSCPDRFPTHVLPSIWEEEYREITNNDKILILIHFGPLSSPAKYKQNCSPKIQWKINFASWYQINFNFPFRLSSHKHTHSPTSNESHIVAKKLKLNCFCIFLHYFVSIKLEFNSIYLNNFSSQSFLLLRVSLGRATGSWRKAP